MTDRVIVARMDDIESFRPEGPAFFGDITSHRLLLDMHSSWTRVTHVSFVDGATTTPHVHTFDQLLVIVAGEGLITSGGIEYPVRAGDVVFTPAGVAHTHGARPGGAMSHFVVMGDGDTDAVS